jgi:hypothetical protein
MRGLKGLVIGMGALIVIGLTVVIVTVVKRQGGDDPSTMKSSAGVSVPVEHGFGEKRVQMPKGAKVVETIIDGNRLVVRLDLNNGGQALLLIDVGTGQRIGLIRLDGSK